MDDPTPELVARLRAAGCFFAEDEAGLLLDEATSPVHLEAMVVRRVAGDPLEQVLGWAGFAGLRIRVRPGVFVPRQRSLLLVSLAVDHLDRGVAGSEREGATPPQVLDLGCGSGALGAAVAAGVPHAEVWAVDVDPAAVACARLNLDPERVLLGDLLEPLPAGLSFDVVLANMPYVPTEEIGLMPPEARLHEHRVALDGGADGLDLQRRAIAAAAPRLRPGGVLLVESGARQAPSTATLLRSAGLAPEIVRDDEAGATAVQGIRD